MPFAVFSFTSLWRGTITVSTPFVHLSCLAEWVLSHHPAFTNSLSRSRFFMAKMYTITYTLSRFESWVNEELSIVFFESPHRIVRTLREIQAITGREIGEVAGEMEKRGEVKGEITAVLAPF